MAKSKILGKNILLVGIDSEYFETYFTTKISESNKWSDPFEARMEKLEA